MNTLKIFYIQTVKEIEIPRNLRTRAVYNSTSCVRLRTGDDWCEFMAGNSSLTFHLVVRVPDIIPLLCANISFAIAPDAGFIFMFT